ncbi:MAG: dolichol-phosphate mannosyltransferase [Xenococcaceae cyanobacterium MO_188.B32]|nr:dolichol-phosphate mannosyltransferase [Xenococcaceae cyanobacterium MO_188.B32]
MKLKNISLPPIIILVGILFSVYLQGQVPEGVYFSGDAGLKALLSQQLARGDFRFDLIPPAETWIRNLWQDGFYPYEEPYVYNVAGKYYITFPYIFSLVTAPFYALFGYRGLYLIPLLSLWIIWFNLYLVCYSFKFKKYITSVALICLIFTSYLTFYSATYWEHTLSLALCCSGITLLLFNRKKRDLSIYKAVLSGFLLGFAVWFRPEFICVVGLISALVILAWVTKIGIFDPFNKIEFLEKIYFLNRKNPILLTSTFLTIGAFFLTNKLIYNHALGIHAIQVVEKNSSLVDRLLSTWGNFQGMSIALLVYLPIIYFPLTYLIIYLLQKIQSKNSNKSEAITYSIIIILIIISFLVITSNFFSVKQIIQQILLFFILIIIYLFILKDIKLKFNFPLALIYLTCLLFLIGVSILVPVGTAGLIAGGKQWGPRFLLMLVPVVCLVTAIEVDLICQKNKPIAKYFTCILLTILSVLGIHKNIIQATAFLQKNTLDIMPAVHLIRQDSNRTVAISHQFVGQVLEPAVEGSQIFFKVENEENLIKLSQTLIRQQQPKFTYICYPSHPCNLPKTESRNLQFIQGDRQYQITMTKLGKFGKYPIYEVLIKNQS